MNITINLVLQDYTKPAGAIYVRTYDIPERMTLEEAIKIQRFIQGFIDERNDAVNAVTTLQERIRRANQAMQQVHDDLNGYHEEVEAQPI